VAKERKKYWLILFAALFMVYVFAAAQPIPRETVLVSRWLNSLESGYPVSLENAGEASGPPAGEDGEPLPFILAGRFGYVDSQGQLILNRARKERLSLSGDRWAEYGAAPEKLEIRSPWNEEALLIERGGMYPFFLDGRIFLLGGEMNSVSALDEEGELLWAYDFSARLTCVDAAAGYFLAGSLDGRLELLDREGKLAFPPFEPGGSRIPAIYGCALSRDASRIAVISGIDDQRFLLLERFGESYRVVYHEFLSDGFRRRVNVAFIDNDSRVAFEQEGGLGIYDIQSRNSLTLPLRGEIEDFDGSGEGGIFFVITAPGEGEKRLAAVRLPGRVIMEAPFKSENAFLGRRGSRIYVGGGTTLAAFELGRR
jgi:hypothetical protein